MLSLAPFRKKDFLTRDHANLSSYPCAITPYVTAAPEPATWAIVLFGTFGLLAFGKRQGLRRQAS
ncbi:MAG: PEP-CTERM sorting domain-containing protein [Alphaproteobacteria bacterium]|nr:PEP-CTERM sorting domain-containing protein [Alphaproteobacteria bacterium]